MVVYIIYYNTEDFKIIEWDELILNTKHSSGLRVLRL